MKAYTNFLTSLVLSATFIFMSGCAPTTSLTASWSKPEARDNTYDNLLVTALINDVSARQYLEGKLANEIAEDGNMATSGLELFPPALRAEKEGDKEALLDAIKEYKFDGVLTINLIQTETETEYVPGSYPYTPANTYSYYGNFWGYYNYWYPRTYATGYYDLEKTYFLETNLYDAETEELLWSAQTKTVDPNTLESFSEDFATLILRELKKEGVFK